MKIRFKSIVLITLLLVTGCTYSCETNKHREQIKDQSISKKTSLELYSVYNKNKDSNTVINVIVRTITPLTQKQIKELNDDAIHINTISDNIFTANIKVKDVKLLAEKPYVEFIDLSKELKLLQH
jgi:hypothetical protein